MLKDKIPKPIKPIAIIRGLVVFLVVFVCAFLLAPPMISSESTLAVFGGFALCVVAIVAAYYGFYWTLKGLAEEVPEEALPQGDLFDHEKELKGPENETN